MRKALLLFFLLILFSSINHGFAQNKTTITGSVKDSSQKPLSFVTVNLFRGTGTIQPFRSTYTDTKGAFSFSKLDTGIYLLNFSHTGYAELNRKIKLDGNPLSINDIALSPVSSLMKGVTVTARKPLIEQTDDKIVYNTESDPASKTETAIDILRKTPFVSVDGDNNIQVNGQSNFKVLLNGRETGMFTQNPKEALKGFPGALITKIEVITTPSAIYDAEGVGGIINIITQKKVVGYNGSISGFYSTQNNYSTSANINLKYDKLGVTGFYSRSGGSNMQGHNTIETVPLVPSLFTKRTIDGARVSDYFYNFGNLEISYELDSFNTISAYGNLNGGNNKMRLNQLITTEFPSSSTSNIFNQDSRYETPSATVGSDYIRKYRGIPEKEFSIRFNGSYSKNYGYNNSLQTGNGVDRFVLNNTNSLNHEYTIQSDYILPLKNGKKLESGIKGILRRASSDFESLLKYNPTDDYKINPDNSNLFNYHQEVYSIYSTYAFKVTNYNFRLGARLEHTDIEGNFLSSNASVVQHYNNLIPNFQVTRKWNQQYTSVLTYTIRLQRPYITNLNPFIDNNDSLNISYGNPNLGPQTIHNLSLQTRLQKGKTFAGITLYLFYSHDQIQQFPIFHQNTGVTETTYGNIGKEAQATLGFNINTALNNFWNIGSNLLVRYNDIRSTLDNSIARSGFSGSFNMNSSYKVTPKFTISGSGGFFKSPKTISSSTGFSNGYYQVNFGYKFFNEKLSTTINFNNFFVKDRTVKYVVDNPSFRTTNLNTVPYRVIYLGATWNFGKLKENVSKKKGVTNDDLLSGGQSN